ncbi:Voltage-gated hydrogen channel 1 [Pseudolycoriella hygida]|uniref:Voltage-gated hydrogen channel 1 n=1 Tax=Pseudolycoriella hygida TaxID=35572 RepID=A0A9Q0S9E1_9DIPT|nr:Voltage-gated hydrogen channel 1 [Pseudolycoriella hygida]
MNIAITLDFDISLRCVVFFCLIGKYNFKMESDEECKIPVAAHQTDPLVCGVKMSEIRQIAGSRLHSRRQSGRTSSLFKIPSAVELKDESFRGKCIHLIHSFKFQSVVIGFVMLDCIFVVAELIIDLRITKAEVCDKVTCAPIKKDHSLSMILQSLSLSILSLFMIELAFKLWALRSKFFESKMEIFDAIIVIVSWSLDIVFFHHGDDADAISMLIFLRMWRLIRIVHAIAVSMITPVVHQLEQEEHAHYVTEVKLEKLTEYTKELEIEIKELRQLLDDGEQPVPQTRVKETTAGIKDL